MNDESIVLPDWLEKLANKFEPMERWHYVEEELGLNDGPDATFEELQEWLTIDEQLELADTYQDINE